MQLGWDSLAIVACKKGAQLQAALVARPGSCIRRLAGGHRARQVQFSRFLYNEAVTVAEMASTAAARTAGLVAGRDVLAIQDSSELAFGGEAPCDCAPSRRPGQAAPPSTHQPPEQHAAAVHLFPRRAPPVQIREPVPPRPRTPVHCCPGSPRHRVPQPSRRSAPPRSTPSRRRSRPRCTENARTGLAGPDGLPPADGCTILAARPAQLAAEPPFCRRRSPNCPSPTASQTHVIEGLPRINRLHGISPLPWKQSRCVHTTARFAGRGRIRNAGARQRVIYTRRKARR